MRGPVRSPVVARVAALLAVRVALSGASQAQPQREDARMLEAEGMNQVWVTELEEGEVGEDDAVMQVASEIGCGTFEIRLAAGVRANLFATEPCCVLVDDELLKQINCTASMAIATSINFLTHALSNAWQR